MSMDLAQLRPTLVAMARQVMAELAGRSTGPTVRPGTVLGAGVGLASVMVMLDGEGQAVAMQYLGARPRTGQRVMVLLTPPHGALVLNVIGLGAGPAAAAVTTGETTTSSVFVDLATVGPAVSLVTGAEALVTMSSFMDISGAGNLAYAAFAVTGATTIAPVSTTSMHKYQPGSETVTRVKYLAGLTPGLNTFTMKYQVSAGTGTFSERTLAVQPL